MKCVEEHQLEEQYPLEAIRKQVVGLEKAKYEKKQTQATTEVVPPKPQPKRPRANVVANGHPIPTPAPAMSFYPRVNERYPPYIYERPPYVYPAAFENHGPPLVGTAPYNHLPPPPPPGHGNYFGNVYHYQGQYLH